MAALTDLRAALAALYHTNASARIVARDAGLALENVNFDRPPSYVWDDVLTLAINQHRLWDLVDVVERDAYARNPVLVNAVAGLRASQKYAAQPAPRPRAPAAWTPTNLADLDDEGRRIVGNAIRTHARALAAGHAPRIDVDLGLLGTFRVDVNPQLAGDDHAVRSLDHHLKMIDAYRENIMDHRELTVAPIGKVVNFERSIREEEAKLASTYAALHTALAFFVREINVRG